MLESMTLARQKSFLPRFYLIDCKIHKDKNQYAPISFSQVTPPDSTGGNLSHHCWL